MCTYEFYNPFQRNCNCGQNHQPCSPPCQNPCCGQWQQCNPCQKPPCQPCFEPFPPQPPICPPNLIPTPPQPPFHPINNRCCNELIWLLIGIKLAKNCM